MVVRATTSRIRSRWIVDADGPGDVNVFPRQFPVATVAGGLHRNIFLTQFNAAGSLIGFSSFLGGTADETGNDVALAGGASDSSAQAFLTGNISSASGFSTPGTYAEDLGGGIDGFVARVHTSGGSVPPFLQLGVPRRTDSASPGDRRRRRHALGG